MVFKKKRSPKYLLESNLSERQIETDLQSYLTWCTPVDFDLPFRLLVENEQVTGADRSFTRGIPIYMQFKKSKGLRPSSEVKISKNANRSKMEDIREYREDEDLSCNPSLFFLKYTD